MLWLTAACEGLDDDHAATAAGTWTQQRAGFVDCCFGRLGFFQARRHREQLAGACDIGRAVAIGSAAGNDEPLHALWRPAAEKRQGTKSRAMVQRRCRRRYGDLATGYGLRRLERSACNDRLSAK